MKSFPLRANILHLEDSPRDADLIRDKLEADGLDCYIERVDNRADFSEALDRGGMDIILCDYNLPDYDGISALKLARLKKPHTPVMLISGSLDDGEAVKCLEHGATDYLLKQRLERLAPAVRRALQDVEEARQRELAVNKLRESDERFRQITENSADLISLLDVEGTRIYTNPAYRRHLNIEDEATAPHCFDKIHSDDVERVKATFKKIVEYGQSKNLEYRFNGHDGEIHFIESHASAVRDAAGIIVNVLVVSRDVTERKHTEDRIREQAALLDHAQDAIYVRDLNLLITYWNKGAERLYGYTEEEVVGNPDLKFHPPNAEKERAQARLAVRENGEWMGELHQISKGGKAIIVESRRTLLRDENGDPKSILIINTDVTERKKTEALMLRAQRLESIGTLAGGVAHDLNNALAPILMATDLLRMKYPGGTELVDTIEASAQRGADMVRQLLTFAKGVEGSRLLIKPEYLLKEIEQIVRSTFPKTILLQTHHSQQLHSILGDSTQLHQVLLNLCVNARDAMPDGGTLTIESDNVDITLAESHTIPDARVGKHVLWRVSDNGTGIPQEIIDRIFEPFFSTKSPDKGTGLGLSTILGIVQSHHGFLRVESTLGKGSTFSIYLPAEYPPCTTHASVLGEEPPFRGNGESILVVDDEPAVREVANNVLTALNFSVLTAANGTDALRYVSEKKNTLCAIITDMHMPQMDGLTFARALRFLAPDVPIIISSGRLDDTEAESFQKLGIRSQLDKPFTQEKLSAVLREAVQQNGESRTVSAA